MCFSFAGRIQTRLATLVVAWAVAWLFSVSRGTSAYLVLFGVMAAVTLLLDLALYVWLIDFQARWLTLLLALFEFLVIKWVVEWPYPLEVRLRTLQALEFYLVAWSLNWLLIFVLLPLRFPRWQERGGQFWWGARADHQPVEPCALRRQSYLRMLLLVALATLPWWFGHAIAGPERVFGWLGFTTGHLADLARLVVGEQGKVTSIMAGFGAIAAWGWWPSLQIYQVSQVVGLALFSLGLQRVWPQLALGWLALLVVLGSAFPSGLLWSLTLLVWLAQFFAPLRRLRFPDWPWRPWVATLGLWLWLTSQLWYAPFAFFSQGEMQLSAWLAQQPSPPTIWSTEPRLIQLAQSLGQARPVAAASAAQLVLERGAACLDATPALVMFRHGALCALGGPLP